MCIRDRSETIVEYQVRRRRRCLVISGVKSETSPLESSPPPSVFSLCSSVLLTVSQLCDDGTHVTFTAGQELEGKRRVGCVCSIARFGHVLSLRSRFVRFRRISETFPPTFSTLVKDCIRNDKVNGRLQVDRDRVTWKLPSTWPRRYAV